MKTGPLGEVLGHDLGGATPRLAVDEGDLLAAARPGLERG